MDEKHSPGPWVWDQQIGDNHGRDRVLWAGTGRKTPLVVETIGHQTNPGREVNRRLIAAAPELLAALKMYVEHLVRGPDFDDLARALIARIEGEPTVASNPPAAPASASEDV
jgi:hypothetical protein